jgi:hypothetical protein
MARWPAKRSVVDVAAHRATGRRQSQSKIAKPRQVDVLPSQGQTVADANPSIGSACESQRCVEQPVEDRTHDGRKICMLNIIA